MNRVTDRKVILVTRKTRLENLITKYNTIEQARFIIEHSGSDFSDYMQEHSNYQQVISYITGKLEELAYVQVLDREYLSGFIFGKEDIVVVVGQDGIVANTLKYLEEQPLLGVNPDPKRYDGVLLPFEPVDLQMVIKELLNGKRKQKEVTLAKVSLQDGQTLLGVNDIFIGQKTHVSASYILESDGYTERQSSSGIIVSTGLGSTGWFKSILAGASGIVSGGFHKNHEVKQQNSFGWDSNFLYYTVREPYPSRWTKADMVFGKIESNSSLKIESLMPENGVIFSDGMESDYLDFHSGCEAIITVADKKGQLVV